MSWDVLVDHTEKKSFCMKDPDIFISPSQGNPAEEDDLYVQTTEKCPGF